MVSPSQVLTRLHLRVKAFLAQLVLVRRGLRARTMIERQHQLTRCASLLGAGLFHTHGLIELNVASVVGSLQLQDIWAGDGRQGGAKRQDAGKGDPLAVTQPSLAWKRAGVGIVSAFANAYVPKPTKSTACGLLLRFRRILF